VWVERERELQARHVSKESVEKATEPMIRGSLSEPGSNDSNNSADREGTFKDTNKNNIERDVLDLP